MKFAVEIAETLSKTIEVVAESTEEAIMIAEDQYHNEHLVLDSSNFQGVEFRARKVDEE